MVDVLSSSQVRSLPEREQLALLVQQWNENRLDLFHLSYPTEELEIEGVMRFYFQDGGERVLTKCVRVSSTATTRAVVDALADKFLPDLKMLTEDSYSLWEVHENSSERKLDDEEKPLLVQLNWHRDDREGRFLLRRDNQPTIPLSVVQQQAQDARVNRYLKKDKKENRKKTKEIVSLNGGREEPIIMNDIYRQIPQNTFTRTISNPEVVMKKKREKKLEAKLKEIDHGGSLKIYGGELMPSRPYVSILVSVEDQACKILNEALEKYGFESKSSEYVLVELPVSGNQNSFGETQSSEGRIIEPMERPLQNMHFTENGPDTYLAIRKTPSDYRVPATVINDSIPPSSYITDKEIDPAFLVLQPDGTPSDPPQWICIAQGITEIGSDKSLVQYSSQNQNIYIDSPDICGRHCVITLMDGITTITPSADVARLEVNQKVIHQTEILANGSIIVIGRKILFQFFNNKNTAKYETIQSEYSDINHVLGSISITGSSADLRKPTDTQRPRTTQLPTMGQMTLPISLQIGDYKVWDYLVEVMSRGYVDSVAFRLAPAYALYLALRFFHSHSKPYLVQFFSRISHHMNQISQECASRDELLFWLANASELSYIVERNPDLRTPRSGQFGSVVEGVFRRLCTILLGAVRPACGALLDNRLTVEDATRELKTLLDNTLRAARASCLNPALTIQLCSQMFHTINSTIFNNMIGMGSMKLELTTRFGRSLVQRLSALHRWAEQMGVELAAECHLDRCRQAANLIAAQKNDIAVLGSTCYKLNSLQVRYLLTNFIVENGEIPCESEVLNRIVSLSERQADVLTQQDGLPVTLEEPDQLSLPFLLPQDGYTSELLKTVPDGLAQYLYGLRDKGLCHSVNLNDQIPAQADQTQNSCYGEQGVIPTSAVPPAPIQRSASQTTLTNMPNQFGENGIAHADEILRVVLSRGNGGIGLSIVAAQGIGDRQTGIYIKKVVDGSPAALDGRLAPGDQLLSVNGQTLLGITQEDAAQYMARSGSEIHFEVKKGAANKNGLAVWLQSNVPVGQINPSQSSPNSNYAAPSPAMSQSMHSQPAPPRPSQIPPGPPPYSNYSQLPKYGSQQSVQVLPYQQRHQQINASRSSAFQPPPPNSTMESPRHVRSISASELYQNDPNASYSQRSIASTTTGFDKLPAHYRHSSRPTVVQPGRPCPSPTTLRRGAHSPVSLYRPPSTNGLHRPPSVTNLFAPPRSPNPLQQQGYLSQGVRESTRSIDSPDFMPMYQPNTQASMSSNVSFPISTRDCGQHTLNC